MNLIPALYARLAGDAALVALLDTHTGSPAIFSGDVLPADYDLSDKPCVIIGPVIGDANRDSLTEYASEVSIRLRLYAKATQSTVAIDDAASRVRELVHRFFFTVTGATRPVSGPVSWPQSAPTSEIDAAGRMMTARLLVQEN